MGSSPIRRTVGVAQSVESQTENLFAQVRFLEVPLQIKNREELHWCLEFLRFFFKSPLFSTFLADESCRFFTCAYVNDGGTGGNRTHGALLHELISGQPPYDRLDTVPYAVS